MVYKIEPSESENFEIIHANSNEETFSEANKIKSEYKKALKGRGGKRAGAGRPKGTTGAYKDKVKKSFTFRLSEEEEIAVRKLLKEMRGH